MGPLGSGHGCINSGSFDICSVMLAQLEGPYITSDTQYDDSSLG